MSNHGPLLSGAQSGHGLITHVGPDAQALAASDTSLKSYHNRASSTNCPDKEVPILRPSRRRGVRVSTDGLMEQC